MKSQQKSRIQEISKGKPDPLADLQGEHSKELPREFSEKYSKSIETKTEDKYTSNNVAAEVTAENGIMTTIDEEILLDFFAGTPSKRKLLEELGTESGKKLLEKYYQNEQKKSEQSKDSD